MNYYIADPHFGHSNIIRLNHRPFNSVEEMDEILIKNWNERVKDTDVVYIIGDFSFKSVTNPIKVLKRLKGQKVLIEGNHDCKNLKNIEFRNCFSEICSIKEIYDGGKRVIMCHYPLVEWNGYFRGSYLVYGHIHNNTINDAFKIMKNIPNALNAGVDITNYYPVTIDELIECNKIFNRKNS